MHKIYFHVCIILSLLLCNITVYAQDETTTEPEAQFVTSFPFRQYYGGVVVLEAKLDEYPDTLQFLLDTGSAGISLDTGTCIRLGIDLTPSDKIVRGLGASKNISFAHDRTLHFPGLSIDSLDFHVNDYQLISQVYGLQIDGIIGYSFLSKYIVHIDYDKELILVYTFGNFRYPRGGHLMRPNLTFIPVVSSPMRSGKRETSHRFYFDTGAGMCLLLSTRFVKDSSLLQRRKVKVIPTEAQGLGGKMQMFITTITEFRVGIYNFRNVPTYLFDDVTNITSYPSLGGMIGNDLLRRFNITLNYARKEIYLMPNTHFRDQFDYSYTGLIIYLIDGRIEVTDVIKGSPAEKAGFKKGDFILAVNNNFSNSLQVYRDQLKNIGTRPTLLLLRDGKLLLKKLPIRSIL
ncbi:pepsin/retropepsin-like aspartic protease family protein [Chitinophaga sp. XS-30]|uniref:pepsin/retropepsin-like aspartic protease family protein n=1 Tax=Chitinophaga sp. XS-30 TaxID=2604421 RepID=UPI0011DD1CEB|nr:aspartyl protease family protein [Chitinophaga sp. XS-30]QEH40078.1 PDZ domain-containing protein [Chitinophaga sp. XS-30]